MDRQAQPSPLPMKASRPGVSKVLCSHDYKRCHASTSCATCSLAHRHRKTGRRVIVGAALPAASPRRRSEVPRAFNGDEVADQQPARRTSSIACRHGQRVEPQDQAGLQDWFAKAHRTKLAQALHPDIERLNGEIKRRTERFFALLTEQQIKRDRPTDQRARARSRHRTIYRDRTTETPGTLTAGPTIRRRLS